MYTIFLSVCLPAGQKRASDLISDGCEPPCGCWELNSGPLEEQAMLLTTEPSLQPPSPLFLTLLAIWLSTFFNGGSLHPAALVVWAGVGGINFLLPRILLFSLQHFYFLSGFPTYTSCLANQHLFKT